jgi:hypothetical protein
MIMGGTGLRPVVSGVTPETIGNRTSVWCMNKHQPSVSHDEIRRDAEFNPRDAGATHKILTV